MTVEIRLDHDLDVISNSLRMLPSWEDERWWQELSQITKWSLEYLEEKLEWITTVWRKASSNELEFAGDRAKYILMLFDNPALYAHLDAVQPTWHPPVPGGIGRRWVEEICAAAWRVIVATESGNEYSSNFSVST